MWTGLLLIGILCESALTAQIVDLTDVQDDVVICKGAISLAEFGSFLGSVVSSGAVNVASSALVVGGLDAVGAIVLGADAKVIGLAISRAAITFGANSLLVCMPNPKLHLVHRPW
jgi:hypothetical protein